jgi:hypothetical protein
MRILTWRNLTSAQNYHDINKTNSNQYEQTPVPIFLILYFIITFLITLHIDFPLLGIVSDLLHICIIILLTTFHMWCTSETTKKSCICHFIVILTSPIFVVLKVVFLLQIVEKSSNSPLVLSLRKDHRLLQITLYLIIDFNFDYISCILILLYEKLCFFIDSSFYCWHFWLIVYSLHLSIDIHWYTLGCLVGP